MTALLKMLSHRPLAGLMVSVSLIAPAQAEAAIINAESVSLKDVTSALASAADGDTVIIPAGIATWTGRLTIAKAITLQGSGIGKTIIKDGIQDNKTRLINFTLVADRASRLTGIEFQDGGRPAEPGQGFLGVNGSNIDGRTMRIDHCKFDRVKGHIMLQTVLGVADHNEIITKSGGFFNIYGSNWNGATSIFGDASWHAPINWGSGEFFFIEDNTYTGIASVSRGFTDSYAGGRVVVRHNTITDGVISNHGTDSTGRLRSCLAMDIYGNTFSQTSTAKGNQVIGIRGGVILIHDNTCSGFGPNAWFSLSCFRMFMPSWQGASGTNPWDINRPGGPFYSGTASVASVGETVTASGSPNWAPNQWAGYSIKRTTNLASKTDAGFSEIKSNMSNTLTYHNAGGFRADLSFAAGDSFQIWKVDQALDQPGVAGGRLLTIRGLSPFPRPPLGWNDQVITPCYSWNNTREGGVHVNFGRTSLLSKEGVHYFNDTEMPGYTPYTYPHPLVTGKPAPTRTRSFPAATRMSLRKPWGGKQKEAKQLRKPVRRAKENPTDETPEDKENLGD